MSNLRQLSFGPHLFGCMENCADDQIPPRIRRYFAIRHDDNDPIIHVRFFTPYRRNTNYLHTAEEEKADDHRRWLDDFTHDKWVEDGETTPFTVPREG